MEKDARLLKLSLLRRVLIPLENEEFIERRLMKRE
jgi:hypothetical protein